jgi:hypothetical protein
MRALVLSLCVAALAALALPAGAFALIAVDHGIAGARLDNTVAQVHAALGKPLTRHTGHNDFSVFLQETYRGGIVVFYQGAKRVSSIATTGLGDRTTRGVGIGSTEATVKAKVAGVRCETISGSHSCHTHSFAAGQRVTDFLIKGGKVFRVSVGIVID